MATCMEADSLETKADDSQTFSDLTGYKHTRRIEELPVNCYD